MTVEKANKIYDILVDIGDAIESNREDFVYNHTQANCREWRFEGKLGSGGKYYSDESRVSTYSESLTPSREILITKINEALSKI